MSCPVAEINRMPGQVAAVGGWKQLAKERLRLPGCLQLQGILLLHQAILLQS